MRETGTVVDDGWKQVWAEMTEAGARQQQQTSLAQDAGAQREALFERVRSQTEYSTLPAVWVPVPPSVIVAVMMPPMVVIGAFHVDIHTAMPSGERSGWH